MQGLNPTPGRQGFPLEVAFGSTSIVLMKCPQT